MHLDNSAPVLGAVFSRNPFFCRKNPNNSPYQSLIDMDYQALLVEGRNLSVLQ